MDEYQGLKPKDEKYSSKNNCCSKNDENIKIIDLDDFEDNLNISDIKDEFKKIEKEKGLPRLNGPYLKIYTGDNIDKDFSVDLDNINEDEFNERKISICSLQSEEFNCNIINKNNNDNNKRKTSLFYKQESKKLTKEDLNYIPLPVFSCIYCSNDEISFKHLSREIIWNKYLFQTSIFDIIQLNKLIDEQPTIDKDLKSEKLLTLILNNTEFVNKYNSKEISYEFFKSNKYLDIINKELIKAKKIFISRIEGSVAKKKIDFYFMGINKISKNSLNNKCLFNSTNSLINNYNALSGFVETIPINNNININNGKINNNISNISINFNSISLNNNEIGCLGKDNNNLLVSAVEKIEKNIESVNEIEDKEEIMDFFDFDTERKIKRDDIIWDNIIYDIWNPDISNDDDEFLKKEENDKIRKLKIKVNLLKSNDKSKTKTSNNSLNYKINKNISVSQIKSFTSTNNSSVINNENDNKMKNNLLNNTKYLSFINESYSNNSTIKVNSNSICCNEKKYYSNVNNISSSNKINDILNKLKINYKIKHFNANKTKNNIKEHSVNKIHDFSLNNFNSKKSVNNKLNSDIKNKTFFFNKIIIKDDFKKKNEKNIKINKNYNTRKLNLYSSYASKNNNSSILYKVPLTNRAKGSPNSNLRNGESLLASSKNRFIKSKIFLDSFNIGYKKKIKSPPKKINLSNYANNHQSMKISFNINKGKAMKNVETNQINKKNGIIKRCNSKLNNKKVNTSLIIQNKINKLKKNIEQEITVKRNSKFKISKNKKIFFPISFINLSISKVIAIKKKDLNHFKK